MAGHVRCDGGLTDVDPEFQEFAVDPRRAPQRVRGRHRANQNADIEWHGRPTEPASALPGPQQSESAAMPADNRVGLDDHECRSPVMPNPRQPDPEQAVDARETNPAGPGSITHAQLVPQREYFELQRRACEPTIEPFKSKDTRTDIIDERVSRNGTTSTPATRTEFSPVVLANSI
jgi:hypothetical protein